MNLLVLHQHHQGIVIGANSILCGDVDGHGLITWTKYLSQYNAATESVTSSATRFCMRSGSK